jgi:hypothetical protein
MKMIKLPMLFLACTALFNPFITNAQHTEEWKADTAIIRRQTERRPGFIYKEEDVPNYTLPDLMVRGNGKPVKNISHWEKYRRSELIGLFETNIYGRVPETPYRMSFITIEENTEALNGDATFRQVRLSIFAKSDSLSILLNLFLPNNTPGPFPAYLLINTRDPGSADPTRANKTEFWPVEHIIERGYAAAAFNAWDLDFDKYDNFSDGIHALLDPETRQSDSWGTLAAWAWGASRCMDYLETDKDIDKTKVAVLGHSRGGKTALWAGAMDERFALVIGNESGCGGSPIARRRYAETIEKITTSFPHWFCSNYAQWGNNEDNMPVDMHMLMALTAPRALYIACADKDIWGDTKGSWLALYESRHVHKLYNPSVNLPSYVPPLNKAFSSGNIGFHIREGEHNLLIEDWLHFMDFSDDFYKMDK